MCHMQTSLLFSYNFSVFLFVCLFLNIFLSDLSITSVLYVDSLALLLFRLVVSDLKLTDINIILSLFNSLYDVALQLNVLFLFNASFLLV